MAREMINDTDIEQVVGGSIVFNGDNSACGYNCNDQYKVLDYDAVDAFIKANCLKMPERKMLKTMVDLGYLVSM